MASLFDLEAEILRLQQMVESSEDGELPPDVVEWIDSAEEGFDRRVEAWASVIGQLQAMVEARDKEMLRLKGLRDSAQRSVDRMKQTLQGVMMRIDRPKVETTRYKVWVQPAGGKLSVNIPDESAIPAQFIETKIVATVNRDAIRSALEAGECLEFASLSPRGNVLRIK